jgi:NADH dehydrogenase
MKKIVVIGGGFAGLSVIRRLSKPGRRFDIVLIDKKETFDFLPALPDIIGRRIQPQFLSYRLDDFCKRHGCAFINSEVTGLDLEQKKVYATNANLTYDCLIIASGSETNFYGNEEIKRYAYKLDTISDVQKILEAINKDYFDAFLVAGGGYTGIEVATNLKRYFTARNINKRIIIVEKAVSLLGPLPAWMKQYVWTNLKRLNIDVFLDCSIRQIESDKIYLSNNKSFNKAMLIWTAGVKTADFIFNNLNTEKSRQGRLKVDEFLRLTDSCFVLGDAADFYHQEKPLRMAVQFSIAEGQKAAINITRSILGLPLKKYKPKDYGYIIPMANNLSCGNVLGVNFRGILATVLHYFMCIYRSYGLKNKLGIIKDLAKGARR